MSVLPTLAQVANIEPPQLYRLGRRDWFGTQTIRLDRSGGRISTQGFATSRRKLRALLLHRLLDPLRDSPPSYYPPSYPPLNLKRHQLVPPVADQPTASGANG